MLVLEGGLRNLVHDGAVRAPGLIGVGRLADLDLNGAEVHGDVEPEMRQLEMHACLCATVRHLRLVLELLGDIQDAGHGGTALQHTGMPP